MAIVVYFFKGNILKFMCMEIQKGELNMKISSLQKARYEYSPKLRECLEMEFLTFVLRKAEETQSVADQEKIKALFPNTYGKKEITFQQGENTSETKNRLLVLFFPVDRLEGTQCYLRAL